MHSSEWESAKRRDDNGRETEWARDDVSQARHQTLEGCLLFVMVAVADAGATSMTPDLGGDEEKAESGGGQRRMLERVDVGLRFAVEQHQPSIQVVSEHGQLKMIPIHVKAAGGMGRQSRIIVGLFDQILGPSALVIEPHDQRDWIFQVRHEHSVFMRTRFKQLILDLILRVRVLRPWRNARR